MKKDWLCLRVLSFCAVISLIFAVGPVRLQAQQTDTSEIRGNVLDPTGNASPIPQPGSIQGIQYIAPSNPYWTAAGSQFDAYDYEAGIQYMPVEQVTYDLEFNHRQASVPYFAGHGGVTSPDGYITTPTPTGWP